MVGLKEAITAIDARARDLGRFIDETYVEMKAGGSISAELKRPLKFDPVAERFVDEEDANGMLQRPMRPEWKI